MDLTKISEGMSVAIVTLALAAVTYVIGAVEGEEYLKQRIDKMEVRQEKYNSTVDQINGRLDGIDSYLRHKHGAQNDD